MDLQSLARKHVPRTLRNWVRAPRRSLRYMLDECIFALGRTCLVEVRSGWNVRCHPAAASHFQVFSSDPVQSAELDSFIQECPQGIQLLDIGAHYGFFAMAAVHFGGVDARVLCVEASPNAARVLRSTIALNEAGGQVTVRNVAIGAEDGELPMLTTGPLAGDYFVVPREARTDTIPVPQRTIQSLLKESGFAPTHIKLDIEGYEFEVIQASIEFLRGLKPTLFLEIHGDALSDRGKDPVELVEMLTAAGYTDMRMDGHVVLPADLERQGFNCRVVCHQP